MAGNGRKKDPRGVIIKRYEAAEGGGHHGGAWKVAYADFVTAMMAFFLLMWLLNATTEDQRKGLADYFSPNNVMSHASSGTGQPFGGHTAFDEGALGSIPKTTAPMSARVLAPGRGRTTRTRSLKPMRSSAARRGRNPPRGQVAAPPRLIRDILTRVR